MKNGAEIAIAEINALGGQQYEMKFEDDENDAEKAINAYNSLKDWGMQILMGTVTTNPCIAVAAETANDNMFQLTPSGSAEGCIANDNAFRVCFSDPSRARFPPIISLRTALRQRSPSSMTALTRIPPAFTMRS